MSMLNRFFAAFGFMLALGAANAADLVGVASVNVTSDTAATAKNMAFDEARRQIILDTISQYSNPEQLRDAVSNAGASDLTALIASSSIDSEKISDTTYSANIHMTVDRAAIREWMNDKNVQNWLPDGTGGDKFAILVVVSNPIVDWGDLNRIARSEQINLDTKYMMGNQIMAELPSANRAAFTIALREAGWHYSNTDDILRIWK